MQKNTLFYVAVLYLVLMIPIFLAKSIAGEIPHLQKRGNATQLIVDGNPFLVLGGELHNSSSSSLEYMKPIWPKLAGMNINTVLAVVSWDLVEPAEGKFDFALVEGLIAEARQNGLRLILLWFGSWKNGQSHYVPEWVKTDFKRFPRVKNASGNTLEILTPFSENTRQADARAFKEFMKYLKKVDSEEQTVILIQIQNEVGILGETRDSSPIATKAFADPIPAELITYLSKNRNTLLPEFLQIWASTGFEKKGSWKDVFGGGPSTDELFMAWYYARFINYMAEMGKKEYPLPMFVNAWIVQPQDKRPGDYPSGGPQAHVHDIWRAGAPDIDILAPDIYLPNFAEICAEYSRAGNPLFIPESRAGLQGASNAFYAIGAYNSIGYSPFGIDSRVSDGENGPMTQAYFLLSQLASQILEAQSIGTISAVILDQQMPKQKFGLGNYELITELRRTRRSTVVPELGYGIFISTGANEFIVAGADIQVSFTTKTSGPAIAGLASVEEGVFENNKWVSGRRLNGDDIMLDYDLTAMARQNKTGTGLKFQSSPSIQKVRLYRFE